MGGREVDGKTTVISQRKGKGDLNLARVTWREVTGA